jgi:drug/metabolite transporter (DMT)-like permease
MITLWMILSAFGLTLVESGSAAILAFSMPAWSALFGSFSLGERFTVRRAGALAAGLAGVAVLIAGDRSAFGGSLAGPALLVAAAITWGFGVVLHKSVAWAMPSAAVAGWQVTLTGVPLALGALAFERPDLAPVSLAAWGAVAFNVLAIAVLAYIVWIRVIGMFPATVASVSILLTPVVGVACGAWMLGEPVGLRVLAALALIVAAIALVMFEPAGEAAPRR